MDSDELNIYFDNRYATYNPGESVTGKVVLTLDSPKKYQAIKLIIKGKAKTYWTTEKSEEVDGSKTKKIVEHTGHQEYFTATFYLLGSKSGKTAILPRGTHAYPFHYILPSNLPSNFSSDYGYIRYSAKAIWDRPWSSEKKCKEAFKVISQLDLNQQPNASRPVHIQESKTFCCLWCASMPLSIDILLPVRGYVPWQTIPVKVNVENQSGIDVENVKLTLKKVVTYTATIPDSRTLVKESTLAETETGPVGGNETINYDRSLNIRIPLPHSSLGNCQIIDVDYRLDFTAHVSGCFRFNLSGNTYILIGTIPLTNYRMPQTSTHRMDNPTEVHLSMPNPSAPEELSNCIPPSANLAPPTYEKAVYGIAN